MNAGKTNTDCISAILNGFELSYSETVCFLATYLPGPPTEDMSLLVYLYLVTHRLNWATSTQLIMKADLLRVE